MITASKAVEAFKRKHPKLTVTMVLDYDDYFFVFEAVQDTTKTDYNAPYYAVDKRNSKIYNFTPGEDFDKFFDAMDNRDITPLVIGIKHE